MSGARHDGVRAGRSVVQSRIVRRHSRGSSRVGRGRCEHDRRSKRCRAARRPAVGVRPGRPRRRRRRPAPTPRASREAAPRACRTRARSTNDATSPSRPCHQSACGEGVAVAVGGEQHEVRVGQAGQRRRSGSRRPPSPGTGSWSPRRPGARRPGPVGSRTRGCRISASPSPIWATPTPSSPTSATSRVAPYAISGSPAGRGQPPVAASSAVNGCAAGVARHRRPPRARRWPGPARRSRLDQVRRPDSAQAARAGLDRHVDGDARTDLGAHVARPAVPVGDGGHPDRPAVRRRHQRVARRRPGWARPSRCDDPRRDAAVARQRVARAAPRSRRSPHRLLVARRRPGGDLDRRRRPAGPARTRRGPRARSPSAAPSSAARGSRP